MNLAVRTAREEEIKWINEKYKEVNFPSSNFGDGLFLIASLDGEDAGLGRLLRVDDEAAELGGIYVFERFRGKGVASEIVKSLMKSSTKYKRVYCLPFEELKEFYGKYGFGEVEDKAGVPEKVLSKWRGCEGKFEKRVLLMGVSS